MAEKSLLDKVKSWWNNEDEDKEKKPDDSLKARVAAPPPPDVTTTVSTSKTTKTPGLTDGQPSDLEKRARNYDAKFEAMQKQLDTLQPFDRAFFEKKIEEVQKAKEAARGNMDSRELAEKLAHALTQLGAGMHGLKTGTDMSGLKFDKTDWGRKMDSMLEDFRSQQRMILDQQQAAKSDYNDNKSTLLQRGNQMISASGNLRSADSRNLAANLATEKTTTKTENDRLKVRMARKKDWDKFVTDLQNNKKLEDPELARQQLATKARDLGVPAATVEEIINSEGAGWLSPRDVRQIAAKLVPLVNEAPEDDIAEPQQETPPPPGGKKKIRWKSNGQVYEVSDEQLKQFNQADYELI